MSEISDVLRHGTHGIIANWNGWDVYTSRRSKILPPTQSSMASYSSTTHGVSSLTTRFHGSAKATQTSGLREGTCRKRDTLSTVSGTGNVRVMSSYHTWPVSPSQIFDALRKIVVIGGVHSMLFRSGMALCETTH
jgi:hypothetical protein